MILISDEHIEYILNDLSKRGVAFDDLKENILDHVCCIIETEMPEGGDFYVFYKQIIPRFFNNELNELQQETEYLLANKFIDGLIKTLKTSGILSVVILIVGIYCKLNHLNGTGLLLFAGVLLFSLVFLPTLIILKFKDKDVKRNKLLVIVGFVVAFMAGVSSLFKIMQWPWATMLISCSTIAFLVVFVPLYYFTTISTPGKKIAALINTVVMLVIGLLLFGMTI